MARRDRARAARQRTASATTRISIVPDLGKTAAELAPEEKNRISHRGQALQKLLALLKKRMSAVLRDMRQVTVRGAAAARALRAPAVVRAEVPVLRFQFA